MGTYNVTYAIRVANGEHRLTYMVKARSAKDAEKKTVKFVKEYMGREATDLKAEKIKW